MMDLFEPVEVVKISNKKDVEYWLGCPIDKIRFLPKMKYNFIIQPADYYDLHGYLPRFVNKLAPPYSNACLVLRSYQNNFRYTLSIVNKSFYADKMTSELKERMIYYILKYIRILHRVNVIPNARSVINRYKEEEGSLFKYINSTTIADILKELATTSDIYYNPETDECEEYERYLFYPECISKHFYSYEYHYCIEGYRWKILFDNYNVLVFFLKSKYIKP